MTTEAKMRPTGASVAAFIAAVDSPSRRADAETVCAMMAEISGEPPAMWGPSIIGFGAYHYRYASGREGDALRIGFSPRKANLVLYLTPSAEGWQDLLDRLGKAKTSVACLYINKLADVDLAVLRRMIVLSVEDMRRRYPEGEAA